ncbi:hypothetical protein CFP56_033936 [Quercus suber]|uniref:Uncharacterized protein n=1 Tax=Quercus suber TaxID=58331 RepID=A0AAW0JDY3_QUESU
MCQKQYQILLSSQGTLCQIFLRGF